MPNSLEFHPGPSYYFVSTSSLDNLQGRTGGFCTENNMKVIFKVADTREPVRTYQLEHRSGAKIKVVEDGIDVTKHVAENNGLEGLVVSKNHLLMGDSSTNGSEHKISAIVTLINFLLLLLLITSAINFTF